MHPPRVSFGFQRFRTFFAIETVVENTDCFDDSAKILHQNFELGVLWLAGQGGGLSGEIFQEVFHLPHRKIEQTMEFPRVIGRRPQDFDYLQMVICHLPPYGAILEAGEPICSYSSLAFELLW